MTCCRVKLWAEAGVRVEKRQATTTTRVRFQDMSGSLLRNFS
jgi:hypothetical protein